MSCNTPTPRKCGDDTCVGGSKVVPKAEYTATYGTDVAPTWPAEPKNAEKKKIPVPLPHGAPRHACMGLNACKGLDRFGPDGPPDGPTQGQANDCAGQGYCSTTSDHTCHVQNDCKNQGGCGLYGTAKELNNPGLNDCKSLGSCATPINAERFSTNGPNQRYSVWKRAQVVFKDAWKTVNPDIGSTLREQIIAEAEANGYDFPNGPPPENIDGENPPSPFTETGPPYLWVSAGNTDRSAMTACGASGLSGAGGCG